MGKGEVRVQLHDLGTGSPRMFGTATFGITGGEKGPNGEPVGLRPTCPLQDGDGIVEASHVKICAPELNK